MVSITGDVETGKTIARTAADTLKRVHLELGGKAPMVDLRRRRPEGRRRGDPARRLLELRPGLHRRLARDRRAEDLRLAARGARAAGRVAQGRRPAQRRDRDGLGHLARAAGADPRLPRAREGRNDPHGRRHRLERQRRLLRPADDRHRREAGRRDRATRGLRPGRDGAEVRRRRRGDPLGERRAATASRRRSGLATSAAR